MTRRAMRTIDATTLTTTELYFLMTGLVVPRPIAWVSTASADGRCNLAPFSHFTNCSGRPPTILFCAGGEKDTVRNIRSTTEFVVNIVSDDLKRPMRATSAKWPSDIDEFEACGVQKQTSSHVAPPRVAAACAAFECRLHQVIPVGDAHIVVGEVLCFHIAPEIIVAGRVDLTLLQPVGKLSGSLYSTILSAEKIEIPAEFAGKVDDYL